MSNRNHDIMPLISRDCARACGTVHFLIINKAQNELLCPLICYVDKTNIDCFNRFALEPFSFTLSIFKYNVRCKIDAWRVLGYLQDLDLKSSAQKRKMSKGESVRNYHSQLHAILADVMAAQQGQDTRLYNVTLHIGDDQLFVSRIYCPVLFVIGDN